MRAYAYIGLVLALIAYSVWSSNKEREAGYQSCVATYESELRKDLNNKIAENAGLNARNSQLVTDLLNKQPKIKIKYRTITEKVNVYVKDNRACNLTRGAVQLRNEAGDPEQLQLGYHRQLSKTGAGATSTIDQRSGERQLYLWGEKYNELSDRYRTLLNVCENNNKKVVK